MIKKISSELKVLCKKQAFRTGSLYQKPLFDLTTPIADSKAFQLLLSGSQAKTTQKTDIYINPDFLFKNPSILRRKKVTGFSEINMDITVIQDLLLNSFPLPMKGMKKLFLIYPYPGKWAFSSLVIAWARSWKNVKLFAQDLMDNFEQRQHKNKIYQLCYCFETMILALHLNTQIEVKLTGLKKLLSKLLFGELNEQKLLLAADFFHTKASRMSSLIGRVEITNGLSLCEEQAARSHFLKGKVNMANEEIKEIAFLETGIKLGVALQGASLILFGNSDQELLEKSFEIGAKLGMYIHLKAQGKLKEEEGLLECLQGFQHENFDIKKFSDYLRLL